MTFNHRAATAFDRVTLCLGDRPVFHIRKRDNRPDGFTFVLQGINFRHAGRDFIAERVEYRLNVSDLRT